MRYVPITNRTCSAHKNTYTLITKNITMITNINLNTYILKKWRDRHELHTNLICTDH